MVPTAEGLRFAERQGIFDTTCTHGNANLCGGFVEADCSIECPLHQGRFDVRSGRALCAPLTQNLALHEVRVDGGRVFLRLAES